jgi:glucose/mannose-6-phosphate isomerase
MSDFQTQYAQVYSSVVGLNLQIEDAIAQVQNVTIPSSYQDAKNLVMCGMGGSGLAARVIESAYSRDLKVPLTRVNDYNLPGFVDENTLVMCASYSGTTEETIENLNQALKKNAKIIVLATGGDLVDIAKSHALPLLHLQPTHNPSKQPRLAIGYMIASQLVLLSKTSLLPLKESDLQDSASHMAEISRANAVSEESAGGETKKLVDAILNREILLITGTHLTGAAHVIKNQLNETAKQLAHLYEVPELNHHLMEGLKRPQTLPDHLTAVIIHSQLYQSRVQKRLALTQEVIEKQHLPTHTLTLQSRSIHDQVFELIQIGSLATYYLAKTYSEDPTKIPWVDYFKAKLNQSL